MERLKGTDWYKLTDPEEILEEIGDSLPARDIAYSYHYKYNEFLQLFVPLYILKRSGVIELFYAPNYGREHFVSSRDDAIDIDDKKYAEDISTLLRSI